MGRDICSVALGAPAGLRPLPNRRARSMLTNCRSAMTEGTCIDQLGEWTTRS